MNKFELPQQESSDKNPFENEENIIKGVVDFIMSAEEVDGKDEGGRRHLVRTRGGQEGQEG